MTKTNRKRPTVFFRLALLTVLTILSLSVSLFMAHNRAEAATSSTINFQARLLTAAGAVVPDGNYNIEFKLYNASSSAGSSQGSCSGDSACVWTETRITGNKVRVVNGYLTVNLGSVTAFSGINWDQEHWLTMNVGGTGSPGWDGEMTPRLKLTAVPYAFQAGGLANTNGGNRSTLTWVTQTASNSIQLPNEGGTICIQNSSNCGFLTSGGAAGSFVQLQGSSPGTPQTGNLNISGTAIAGTLQASFLDTASAGTLQLGSANATTIQVGRTSGTTTQTINIGTNSTASSTSNINIGSSVAGTVAVTGATTITNRTSGSADTLVVSNSTSTGTIALFRDNSTAVFTIADGGTIQAKPVSSSATAFEVQNTSGNGIFGVDTSAAQAVLGKASTVGGKVLFNNATNSNTVTIQSGTTTSSYALILPTALGASGDCIKDTTGTGVLGFGACGAGGGGGGATLQNSYDNSGTANPQILLTTTNGGIKIRDASGGVSGNLLQIQNAAGTATYFGMATTGLTLQDTAGFVTFLFDSANNHLKIYADGSTTDFADIYYASGEAVFTASTGTTRIGSGSGNISMQLTQAADVFQGSKALTLSGAYSGNDFTFLRNIVAGSNSLTGSVVKIESTSTGSSTLASNLLWINENNSSATGNLILATKNGAGNEKFKVDSNGSITIAGGQSISSSSGNLTLVAGGANTVIAKPGTNSTASFQVQNASSTPFLTADTTNSRMQVGSSSTDSTAINLVLDSYDQSSDPSGVNGAMYYNTNMNKFRCYENGTWTNCISSLPVSTYATSATNNSTTTPVNVTGMSFSLAANTKYHFKFVILHETGNAAAGISFGVTAPASPTNIRWCTTTIAVATANTAGKFGSYCGLGDAANIGPTSGVQIVATPYESVMEGYIQTSAGNSGTLQLRMRAAGGTTAQQTVDASSFGVLTPVQ